MNSRKRGRRSAADLATLSPVYTVPRQSLPPELAGDEAEEYLAIINAEEASWFTRGNRPLLVQYVRHVVQARRISELLDGCIGRRETQLEYYLGLLTAQQRESAMIATLSTKLRLTPQAVRNPRGNLNSGQSPPWEFEGDPPRKQ
jgi:hypothetical protein